MKTVLRNRGKGSSRRRTARLYRSDLVIPHPKDARTPPPDKNSHKESRRHWNLLAILAEPVPPGPSPLAIRQALEKGKTTSLSCQAELCGLCETTGCRCDCHR
jgi:hypothetical protein